MSNRFIKAIRLDKKDLRTAVEAGVERALDVRENKLQELSAADMEAVSGGAVSGGILISDLVFGPIINGGRMDLMKSQLTVSTSLQAVNELPQSFDKTLTIGKF